jgi:hypothetical protein
MIKIFTLVFIALISAGQASAYEVSEAVYSAEKGNGFAATDEQNKINAVNEQVPEFWVSYQWDDSPTYADHLNRNDSITSTLGRGITVVPEPGTITLLTLGVLGVLLRRKISR